MNHRYELYHNGRLINVSDNYKALRLSAIRFAASHSKVYIYDTHTKIKFNIR